ILVEGTSLSAPLVAGTAALLKSARPGLTVDQYRSLLIDTAGDAQTHTGQAAGVQQAGAGLLDADAAVRATVTAYPVSLSFGAGGSDARINRVLTLTNVGRDSEAFAISASPGSGTVVPAVAQSTVELTAGASADVPIVWSASGLATGTYEGFITVQGASSGTTIRVPYWYASTSGEPAHITILDSIESARRRSTQRDAVLFRVTDVSGVALVNVQPQVSVVSGGGAFRGINSRDSQVPGMFGIDVQMGDAAGTNVFRIQVGALSADVSIAGL
ncbi:MAG: S8 family serine peptidase, partial [Acidobacteria bacterium]|nr:S8 family serine peptidase [Acidobacteriota bacterium]